jgi:hypothetical protein
MPGVFGGICGAIATVNASYYFDNPYAIEQTFELVKADGTGITLAT